MKWLVVLAIALVPRIAHPCQCSSRPSLAISPPSQSLLPPNPRLYVFAPIVDEDGDTYVEHFAVKNIRVDTPIETLHGLVYLVFGRFAARRRRHRPRYSAG